MSDDGALLLGRRWRLWEQFSLRGPGFPVGGVLDLAPVDVSATYRPGARLEPLPQPLPLQLPAR
ncbi:hypothetical protein ACWEQJ_34495, partial [Streptomyces cyaneofuscatus]